MGLNIETALIQSGWKLSGTKAVLRKSNGKVMKPPMAKTVSALRVFKPIAKDMPDHAKPKKAIVIRIIIIPGIPVA
jgi:hypothetical protein